MKHFIIRDQYVQLYDGINIFKADRNMFTQVEPTFTLPVNIKQIEYYPKVLHQTIHFNGTLENLDLVNSTYDNYLTKIVEYNTLKEEIEAELNKPQLPAFLTEAKEQLEKEIYSYAANLQEQAVNLYSAAERDRWTTTILPEAQAYSVSQDTLNAPNLTAQHIVRTNITDTNLPEFKEGLLEVVNQVLQSNEYLINYSNFIAGIRGKWLDVVRAFEQTQMETEQEAISRLFNLDWKVGWEMPT